MNKTIITIIILLNINIYASLIDDGVTAAKHGNMTKAVQLWEKACKDKVMGACQNAARVYDMANGVKEDDKKALTLYTKSCNAGYMYSCSRLGLLYSEGKTIKQNPAKALKLYTKACGGDDAFACHKLAVYYSRKKDKYSTHFSLGFHEMACEGNNIDSCIYLGRAYLNGKIVTQNKNKAKEYFSMACDEGNRLGCREARMLDNSGYNFVETK